MPGSAMPPWPKLSDKERSLLVAEVQRLHREGSRDLFVAQLKQDTGEENPEIDPQELDDYVKSRTVPAEASATPTFGDSTAESVGRGKELYVKQGCVSCHGAEGKGDGQQVMVDIEGLPTRPRDLTRGIYKGGHDAASVYRRIALGMPGTPMPSSPNLKPEQIVDMVDFVRSLSDEPTRQAAILNRERLVAKRVAALPDSGADAAWKDAPTTTLRTMPLWWRDNFQSVVHVQAVHDGKALAFRLVWDDSTKNDSAVRVDEFEDLAAVQLTRGPAEPFLGMGAALGALDLWQWRGGLGQTGEGDQLLDEYPFDRIVHRDHDKTKPLPDYITARASGNPLATGQHSGHSLTAIGPGSTTFRPAASQHVTAVGEWNQNRWSVVLRRPLTVPADGGVALSSGGDFSAAFAVWDGATRDRGGQKLVTIWQDLHLE
jgi:mono/diheme cytochrome c family protein